MRNWILLAVGLLCGCGSHSNSINVVSERSLPSQVGRTVTVRGVPQDRKLGACLVVGETVVWVENLDRWPLERGEKKPITVTGKLIEREDLPVFIPRPGEPMQQGIPVPEGTDLRKASRRYLLAEGTWKIVEK